MEVISFLLFHCSNPSSNVWYRHQYISAPFKLTNTYENKNLGCSVHDVIAYNSHVPAGILLPGLKAYTYNHSPDLIFVNDGYTETISLNKVHPLTI